MSLADGYEGFLLDLDGVVYRGNEPIDGAADAISGLRSIGSVVFLTNNSARSPHEVVEHLSGMGIPASADEVVTSAHAVVPLVARRAGEGATIFLVSGGGTRLALENAGYKIASEDADHADAVVVGWDPHADYDKLRRASVLVQRGAHLLATNADASFPAPGGELWPGAGALLAAIETATGHVADVAGKPHRPIFETALERLGTRSVLMVGDRVDTDLIGASAAGVDAVLVRSGASTPADLLDHDAPAVAVLASLADLLSENVAPTRVRAARSEDDPETEALLREAGLPELPGSSNRYVTGSGVGTAAVRLSGEESYLHSVAVKAASRGGGVGTLLVAAAVRAASREGAVRCYLVTEHAEGFFARLGFEPIDRDALPEWISPLATECTTSATAMQRPVYSAQGSVSRRGSRAR